MKNHYIIQLSAYDIKVKKKQRRLFAKYGTEEQIQKYAQELRDKWNTYPIKDLKIELFRIDSMTHIKTFK